MASGVHHLPEPATESMNHLPCDLVGRLDSKVDQLHDDISSIRVNLFGMGKSDLGRIGILEALAKSNSEMIKMIDTHQKVRDAKTAVLLAVVVATTGFLVQMFFHYF